MTIVLHNSNTNSVTVSVTICFFNFELVVVFPPFVNKSHSNFQLFSVLSFFLKTYINFSATVNVNLTRFFNDYETIIKNRSQTNRLPIRTDRHNEKGVKNECHRIFVY